MAVKTQAQDVLFVMLFFACRSHISNGFDADLAEHICSMRLSITKDIFDAAWDVLDTGKKKMLMIDHLSLLNADDFEMCFSTLGEPYQEFTDRSRRHNVTLSDSEEHRALDKQRLFQRNR